MRVVHPRIVKQNVYMSVFRGGLFDRRPTLIRKSNVAFHEKRLTTLVRDPLDDLPAAFLVTTGDRNPGTFSRKKHRRRLAYPRRSARDQRYFTRESHSYRGTISAFVHFHYQSLQSD